TPTAGHDVRVNQAHDSGLRNLPSFFYSDPSRSASSTLSLHDALPIFLCRLDEDPRGEFEHFSAVHLDVPLGILEVARPAARKPRSEEHTSELQSLAYLVCRLLLEQKKWSARLAAGCAGLPPSLAR